MDFGPYFEFRASDFGFTERKTGFRSSSYTLSQEFTAIVILGK